MPSYPDSLTRHPSYSLVSARSQAAEAAGPAHTKTATVGADEVAERRDSGKLTRAETRREERCLSDGVATGIGAQMYRGAPGQHTGRERPRGRGRTRAASA